MSVSPLRDLLVVDLSRYLPGPLVTRLLADLGARVIKVEEPKLGDPSRHAPDSQGEQSVLATMLLSGHESLALDLKKEGADEVLAELLDQADVLVESYRPGTLARYGLDPNELRSRFPRLVICSVSGWGQEGPHAHRAGHDIGYLAIAGSLACSPHMPSTQVADVLGAWSGATAVLAALHERERTGEGAWIDQALLDAAGHASISARAPEAHRPRPVGERHFLTGAFPCYDLYLAKDGGRVALATLEPRFWKRFCSVVGRSDLLLKQFSADESVRAEVARLMASRDRDEWAQLADEHDLPIEPVLSLAEAAVHPQVRERDLVRPGEDELPRLGFPALFDGRRPRGGERFPRLGEHTDALVDDLSLAPGLSRRAQRAAGLGRRKSVKGALLRAATRLIKR